MKYETLTFERDGNVAVITLDRPDAANSRHCQVNRNSAGRPTR